MELKTLDFDGTPFNTSPLSDWYREEGGGRDRQADAAQRQETNKTETVRKKYRIATESACLINASFVGSFHIA